MDPANRSPPSSSSSILIISILGILTTAILLLIYYFIVVKCGLNLRGRHGFITIASRRHRSHRHAGPLTFYSAPTEFRGLEPSSIRAIPVVRFSTGRGTVPSSAECAVCLNEFRDEESLRLLPSCSHAFHIDCIDVWLQSNANCPLCRSDITTTRVMFPFNMRDESVVVEVRDVDVVGTSCSGRADTSPESGKNKARKKGRHVSSMGDECIDIVGREKDERFLVQPMRRSFSMDSCCDRQLYVAMQELLQQNPELVEEADGGSGSGGGRIRRSFFSFGHGRSTRSAVLPVQVELNR